MSLPSQVLFDIANPAGGDLVTQAAVAFAERQEVTWQFNDLNLMLAHFYNGTAEGEYRIPQIYPVSTGGNLVGYVAMPQNHYNESDLSELVFWPCLQAAELATATDDGYEFLGEPPLTCAMSIDGQTIGLMGYQQLPGPELPTDAINYALRQMMGVTNWPSALEMYLYPVSHGTSAVVAGVLVAPRIDGLNANPKDDDGLFARIRNLFYPNELPWIQRAAGRNKLNEALKQFPDFESKEFA